MPTRLLPRSLALLVAIAPLASVSLGCDSGNTREPATPATTSAATSSAKAPEPAPTFEKITKLTRAGVSQQMKLGVGQLLHDGRIEFDPTPVMKDGKYHGLKLVAFRPDWDIGLRPGDVVTKVNGIRIQTPFDAQDALEAMGKRTSLRVDFDRDGKPESVELPVAE
jgi:type II secretory pathway component PulC